MLDLESRPLRVLGLLTLLTACAVPGCAADLDGDETEAADDDDEDIGTSSSELQAPGAWRLPGDVHAAGQRQNVRYDDAGPWRGAAGCGGGLLAGTRQIGDHIRRTWPGSVSSYGGYACRQNTANKSKTSVHGTGRALDLFVPLDRGQADNGRGDVVANWLVANANVLGVQLVIWDRAIWQASLGGDKMRGYGGPHPHHDHIHVELNVDGAARRTPWYAGGGDCGPFRTGGAIDAKWRALGGCASAIGRPVTNELPTPDGAGRFNHFERGGSIYWTAANGAWEVHGDIRKVWEAAGWERSYLGYPLTDERTTPDGQGRFNHFQRGSIYWTPATGAHLVQGAIVNRYAALGWERGYLGYPTRSEGDAANGGRFSHFQRGSIYWTQATGAVEVWGDIHAKWASLGFERSPLGYPTAGEVDIPGGKRQTFQNGTATWTAATRAVVVTLDAPAAVATPSAAAALVSGRPRLVGAGPLVFASAEAAAELAAEDRELGADRDLEVQPDDALPVDGD